jgi:hypothetical protein
MHTTDASSPTASASDNVHQSQILVLRELLKDHRNRVCGMWNACALDAGSDSKEARLTLGRFTEKLLNGEMDEPHR